MQLAIQTLSTAGSGGATIQQSGVQYLRHDQLSTVLDAAQEQGVALHGT